MMRDREIVDEDTWSKKKKKMIVASFIVACYFYCKFSFVRRHITSERSIAHDYTFYAHTHLCTVCDFCLIFTFLIYHSTVMLNYR